MSDLVEKVARAIWEADGLDQGEWATIPNPKGLTKEARAAIAVVLNDMYDHTWDNISLREYARENGVSLDDR